MKARNVVTCYWFTITYMIAYRTTRVWDWRANYSGLQRRTQIINSNYYSLLVYGALCFVHIPRSLNKSSGLLGNSALLLIHSSHPAKMRSTNRNTRRGMISCVVATLLTSACLTQGAALRKGQRQQQQKRNTQAVKRVTVKPVPTQDDAILNCPNPMPTSHIKPLKENESLEQEYQGVYEGLNQFYDFVLRQGTLKDGQEENITILPEGDFVLWGRADEDGAGPPGLLNVSAYNKDTAVELNANKNGLNYVYPTPKDRNIESVMEVEGDHAVFTIFHYNVFAHFMLDYLPMIAYMRDLFPPSTGMRFLFADSGNKTQRLLENLDPEFAARVDWIQCPNSRRRCRNQMVRVRNGNLTVMHPKSPLKHMDNLVRARNWILESHPPRPEALDPKQRTVVYITRNHGTAQHGRAMDLEQEQTMLRMIEHMLKRYNRPEKLVVFDGSDHNFVQQLELFQSANLVIGAHGGGMANLLFLLPSESCQERPKVLEFVANSVVPEVQDGGLSRSYYVMYSTCPWVEYHHVLYAPPSNEKVTYVKLEEYKEALNALFKPQQIGQGRDLTQ
jgi:hypothetical protein